MDSELTVGVVGAGTMGMGIAQVAAAAGHRVLLHDVAPGAADQGKEKLRPVLDKLVAKGKMTPQAVTGLLERITVAGDLKAFGGCRLVIEAIVEKIEAKRAIFSQLDTITMEDAILATNTSSLPVTAIASACSHAHRVIGLHFFNPAPLMPLVEVVPGMLTSPTVVARCTRLMQEWGKVPVTCKDTPGFIVNRVARPFYGESLRIYEEGIASMATIDEALRTQGGFRMGPFELMDLIGNDINFAVTRSVWEAFFFEPRYKPSLTQQRQVESGRLGRKTGQGYYDHDITVPRAKEVVDPGLANAITERVLAMLINEAADALFWRVASAQDLDLAMTKGVNYPKGLLAWADEKGAGHWLHVLERLRATYGEERYRPSPLLRQLAATGGQLRAG